MEKGNNPFVLPFLSDNDVTINECYQLGEDIARAVRVYLRMDKDERTALSIEAIGDSEPELAGIVGFVADGMRRTATTRKLREIGRAR